MRLKRTENCPRRATFSLRVFLPRRLLVGLFLFFPIASHAPGPYDVNVVKAIDGNTAKLDLQIWIDLTQRFSLRLDGVNTPEKKDNGVPECEKKHGQGSAGFLGSSNPK